MNLAPEQGRLPMPPFHRIPFLMRDTLAFGGSFEGENCVTLAVMNGRADVMVDDRDNDSPVLRGHASMSITAIPLSLPDLPSSCRRPIPRGSISRAEPLVFGLIPAALGSITLSREV